MKDARLRLGRDQHVQTESRSTVLRSWMWLVSLRMLTLECDTEDKNVQTDMVRF